MCNFTAKAYTYYLIVAGTKNKIYERILIEIWLPWYSMIGRINLSQTPKSVSKYVYKWNQKRLKWYISGEDDI